MAAAGRILGAQDKVLSTACLEIQSATQCDDQLPDRSGVPVELSAHRCFLERDADDRQLSSENIAMRAVIEVNRPFFEMRIIVVASPKAHAPYHHCLLDCFADGLP